MYEFFIILKSIVVLIWYIVICWVIGDLITKQCFSKQLICGERLLIGFLSYHTLFFLIALPLIWIRVELHTITSVWLVCLCIIFCLELINIYMCKKWHKLVFDKNINWLQVAVIIGVGVEIVFSILHWTDLDFPTYVGYVTTDVYTDTVNTVYGVTGKVYTELEVKRLFQSGMVNSAVVSQIFDLHPLIELRYSEGSLHIILSNIVNYLLATHFFKAEEKEKRYVALLCAMFVNYMWAASWNASTYLLGRSYQGKAVVANILMPLIIVGILMIKKNVRGWLYLFLISSCSAGISPSSMIILPIALCIWLFSYTITQRNEIKKNCWKVILVILPGGLILGLWLMIYLFIGEKIPL